ncbi:omh4 [Symbiodinium necroappetens]|uniref:Omh4 protein n=1 Tax=Symbiodinium necroappetens TaxID=1628268 RepID=A0A812J6Z3_9DINO|nr:omh4 [Symbiodinium necroappetens]
MARFVFDLEIWGKHSVPEEMRLASASESAFKDQPGSDRAMLRRYAASVMTETPALRYLLERGAKNNGNLQRGHCGEGLCECLPPFRGPLCELEDPPRVQQKLRAVIHYITAETDLHSDSDGQEARCVSAEVKRGLLRKLCELLPALAQERDLQDLERSLTSLWIHFNKGPNLRVELAQDILPPAIDRACLILVPTRSVRTSHM